MVHEIPLRLLWPLLNSFQHLNFDFISAPTLKTSYAALTVDCHIRHKECEGRVAQPQKDLSRKYLFALETPI